MSHLILLESVHYRRMLWKNGTGTTEEICRYPDHDPFCWRLSIAQVAESGSFSLFSGYQRVNSVLEGKGIKLEIDDQLLPSL